MPRRTARRGGSSVVTKLKKAGAAADRLLKKSKIISHALDEIGFDLPAKGVRAIGYGKKPRRKRGRKKGGSLVGKILGGIVGIPTTMVQGAAMGLHAGVSGLGKRRSRVNIVRGRAGYGKQSGGFMMSTPLGGMSF